VCVCACVFGVCVCVCVLNLKKNIEQAKVQLQNSTVEFQEFLKINEHSKIDPDKGIVPVDELAQQ